ncbi:hypothetical protein NNC19_10940 [Clostridium sp. SHJSY1]|uniref:hypothetical protein n=1 Tax=Clostridium sp. SHJSY1 TaxID=2942483 RepID=UPI002875563E|nr:hypothetical protein [Clostridium sp. SHJSY1]MDS0526197.1 hypothetical protein [Clostridium sp. SHJSY1]
MNEMKTVDLYLASSVSDDIGAFTALLVYKNNSKIIYGTYENICLLDSLLLGLSESLKLLKEKCNVKVNVLSNNIVKALDKNKPNIKEIIRNNALDQVNRHNIEFIIMKIDDEKRIVLDRVKRYSKGIVSNRIRNRVLVEVVSYDYYFRPKEILSLESGNRIKVVENFYYLNGLSLDTKNWVLDILNEYDFNLYNSAAATIDGNINKKSITEVINGYIEKNKNKRVYLLGNEEKIEEIFEYVYGRLKSKNRL